MIDPTDSPAKARLRETVNKIPNRKPYTLMTKRELESRRLTAQNWLEKHPDNQEALKRYDLLVEEIERRG
jgi:hypothetical protein